MNRYTKPLCQDTNSDNPSKKISSDKDVGLFKNLIDVLPSGIFIKNEFGKYLLVNKYVDELVSPKGETLVGKYDRDFFPKKVYEKLLKADRELLNYKKKVIETVENIPTKKGCKHLLTKKQILQNPFGGKERVILAATTDITEIKKIQKKLNDVNSLLRKVTHLIPDIVFVLNLETREISNSNDAFFRLLGYDKEVVENTPKFWFLKMHPQDRIDEEVFFNKLRTMKTAQVIKKEIRYKNSDGKYIWANTIITPFNYKKHQVSHVLIAIEDIHKLKKLQQKFEKESHFDHLTKIFNRRYFMKKLTKILSKSKPFTLLFVDLDKFKSINDTYGHEIGDRLLVETAGRLKSIFRRKSDVVARLGGDEFVVIIEKGLTDEPNTEISSKLRQQFSLPLCSNGTSVSYKPSIGAIYIDSDFGMSPEDVLHKADQAMYRAKRIDSIDIVFFE